MAKDSASGEKIHKIPLTRGWLSVPTGKRADRAVNEIKRYMERHTKASEFRVSQKVNEAVWSRGRKKPPASMRIKVMIDGEKATAMLPDEKAAEKVPEKPKGRLEGLKARAEAVQQGKPVGQVTASKAATEKKDKKTETKETALVKEKTREEVRNPPVKKMNTEELNKKKA